MLHVPGHSNGHLALYDPTNRAVFVGDAVHGSYCPSATGESSLPPAYFSVLAYLSTLNLLEAFEVEWIYSGHWPAYGGPHVAQFLNESRKFVEITGEQVTRALDRHPEGITLRGCIEECAPALGNWPVNNRWLLMYPIYGHLVHLEQCGVARQHKDNGLLTWKLAG